MLSGVRFVAKESVSASKNGERSGGDADDPEMLAKRKEAGLEWMSVAQKRSAPHAEAPSAPQAEAPEEPRVNKELNPHMRDGGEGYPAAETIPRPTAGVVGDGGASWLRKGLKRAQEQASREGKDINEVVEDRWGSYNHLAAAIGGRRGAHANAHLHATRDRKRRYGNPDDDERRVDEKRVEERKVDEREEESREFGSRARSQMRAPRVDSSFKWGKKARVEDSTPVPKAGPVFENDGSFLEKFKAMEAGKPGGDDDRRAGFSEERRRSSEMKADSSRPVEERRRSRVVKEKDDDDSAERGETRGGVESSGKAEGFAAGDAPVENQVAAKAMRLRLMGKNKEADELVMQHKQQAAVSVASKEHRRAGDETVMKRITARQKHTQENRDLDSVLASKIYRSKDRFSADDEYDDVGIETEKQKTRATKKTESRARNSSVHQYNRIQTQLERCHFCFENPSRPKHLTLAIGNYTYLMLPTTAALVPGHCFIVPSQHEGSTRNVDDDVWEEIRNFKKCLLKMFKEQEKEVIFMETVMGLSQQRRHCIVECIPVPPAALKQGPLYFKKAIDEAEEEWSQHNAKKLIDTRVKGLRSSIPKNFPYFHVEFGLEGGYCHIIDDETSFKSNFGRNVLIGMLKLPQEAMHQRSRHESFEQQKAAAKEFSEMWKPHDWTTMLE